MRPLLLVLALVVFASVAAGVSVQTQATVDAAADPPTVTLAAGDLGTPTLGASATSADVAVADLPLLTPDDVLRLQGGPTGWSVRAELVEETGWGGLVADVTVSLSDGSTSSGQVHVTNLGVLQSTGTPVAFTTGTDVELRVVGDGTGVLSLDLVLDPGGGVGLRYRVDVTVG